LKKLKCENCNKFKFLSSHKNPLKEKKKFFNLCFLKSTQGNRKGSRKSSPPKKLQDNLSKYEITCLKLFLAKKILPMPFYLHNVLSHNQNGNISFVCARTTMREKFKDIVTFFGWKKSGVMPPLLRTL
jgi:hypothetical protein